MSASITSDDGISQIQLAELQAPVAHAPTTTPLIGTPQDLLQRVKIRLAARIGWTETNLADLAALQSGDVLTLSAQVDDLIELVYDNHVVARGELVAVGDQLGVRILDVATLQR